MTIRSLFSKLREAQPLKPKRSKFYRKGGKLYYVGKIKKAKTKTKQIQIEKKKAAARRIAALKAEVQQLKKELKATRAVLTAPKYVPETDPRIASARFVSDGYAIYGKKPKHKMRRLPKLVDIC